MEREKCPPGKEAGVGRWWSGWVQSWTVDPSLQRSSLLETLLQLQRWAQGCTTSTSSHLSSTPTLRASVSPSLSFTFPFATHSSRTNPNPSPNLRETFRYRLHSRQLLTFTNRPENNVGTLELPVKLHRICQLAKSNTCIQEIIWKKPKNPHTQEAIQPAVENPHAPCSHRSHIRQTGTKLRDFCKRKWSATLLYDLNSSATL